MRHSTGIGWIENLQPLGLSERHPPQKRARSATTTEAASRGSPGLIIVALHLVFVSLSRSHRRSTGRRSFGGPASMIMQLAILGVRVPDMVGIRGVPGIMGIEDAPLSLGLRGDRQQTARLDLSSRPLTALDQGQKSERASGQT